MGNRHPLADCANCPLNSAENAFVPTRFATAETTLVVVGEAPGYQEGVYGVPFVGPSGQLLKKVLKQYKYRPSEVTFTNACLCRPTGNATPPTAAVNACRGRLLAEIASTGSRDVLALGGTAVSAVMDDSRSITALRVGPPKEPARALRGSNVARVVPTWHPAYCLRNADAFPTMVSDIGKLRETRFGNWQAPQWSYAEEEDRALAMLEDVDQNADFLVVDIEVGIEKDFAFGHPNEYDLLCVGLQYKKGLAYVIGELALKFESVIARLKEILRRKKLIAHNGKFDLSGLFPHVGGLKLTFDTMLAHYCMSPSTRVLKTDLTWTTLGEIHVGDELVAFDEKKTTQMQPAKVLATKRLTAASYRITTKASTTYHGKAEAHTIVCSAQHRWPVKLYGQGKTFWKTTEELYKIKERSFARKPMSLMHFVDPWEVDNTREGGYIAGIFDGEGTLSHTGHNNWRLSFGQNPGAVSGRLLEYVRSKGLDIEQMKGRTGTCQAWAFSRGSRGALAALGMFRPARWMNDTAKIWQGTRHQIPVEVESIEYIGEQEVIGLETSTGTFVAEGFLTHNSLDERPGTHGLKILAVERLGAPKYDDEIKQYVPARGNYANIPRPILYKYNAFDVSCTWDLFELFDEALDRDDVRRVHDFMVAASNELMYLELNGIAIDRAYSNQLQGNYLVRLEAYEARFNEIVRASTGQRLEVAVQDPDNPLKHTVHTREEPKIASINPRSPKQIKEYLATQGINTPSTDVDHLVALQARLRPGSGAGQFVGELLRYRREQKLYGTYVKGIRQRMYRGRVYTTYLLHGTTSGRLASRNPNLQNIVRDKAIRQQFSVSDPSHVLIQADYKNAEARVMATMAGDEYLRGLLSNPDPNYKFFNDLSDQLYGVGKWGKEEYVRSKAFFYGIGYGREAYSIGMEYGIPIKEAERLYDQFVSLIPAVVRWQNSIRKTVLSGEPLITPFGRKRRFALITEQNMKAVMNEALSFKPQSTASDICLDALVHVRPRLKGIGWLRMTIHDALVAECPKQNQDQVASIIQEEMEAAGARYTDYVPFLTDVSFGSHWGML